MGNSCSNKKFKKIQMTVTQQSHARTGFFVLTELDSQCIVNEHVFEEDKLICFSKHNNQMFFRNERRETNQTQNQQSFLISPKNMRLFVRTEQNSHQNKILWKLVENKNCKNEFEAEHLKEGDLLKIGKQRLFFKTINIPGTEKSLQRKAEQEKNLQLFCAPQTQTMRTTWSDTDNLKCRVCYSGETELNPFCAKICNCEDNFKIHLSCFVHQLRSKRGIEKIPSKINYLDRSQLKCEVCHSQFPSQILRQGKKFEIYQPELDFSQYFFIIDVLDRDNEIGGQYLIQTSIQDPQKFCIGRKKQAAIQIRCDTVAEEHAFLYVYRGKVYIVDEDSQYGVLKQVRESVSLKNREQTFIINNFKLNIRGENKRQSRGKKKTYSSPTLPQDDLSIISWNLKRRERSEMEERIETKKMNPEADLHQNETQYTNYSQITLTCLNTCQKLKEFKPQIKLNPEESERKANNKSALENEQAYQKI